MQFNQRVSAETERGGLEIGNFGRKPKGTERQPKDPKEAKRGYFGSFVHNTPLNAAKIEPKGTERLLFLPR